MKNNDLTTMEFTKYKRGSIWYYDPGNSTKGGYVKGVQSFARPCLIISNDKFNSYSPVVNVVFLTSQKKDNVVHEKINVQGDNNFEGIHIKMKDYSYVLCEQYQTINIHYLTEFLGMLSPEKMEKINKKILYQLGIDTYSQIAINKFKEFADNYIDLIVQKKAISKVNSNDLIEAIKLNIDNIFEEKYKSIDINDNNIDDIKEDNNESSIIETPNINKIIDKNNKEFIKETIKNDSSNSKKVNKNSGRKPRYSEEDEKFILENYKNNKEMLMEKYNKTKQELSKLYYYMKTRKK